MATVSAAMVNVQLATKWWRTSDRNHITSYLAQNHQHFNTATVWKWYATKSTG